MQAIFGFDAVIEIPGRVTQTPSAGRFGVRKAFSPMLRLLQAGFVKIMLPFTWTARRCKCVKLDFFWKVHKMHCQKASRYQRVSELQKRVSEPEA
jgi:hypothetical protein